MTQRHIPSSGFSGLIQISAIAISLLVSPSLSSAAELRDGKLIVDGKPMLKRSAYFGYNTWAGTEKGSLAPFVLQPLNRVGSSTDFYTQAGFNVGHYAVHPKWLEKDTPFDPTHLRAAIERAKKAGQKITLNIWVTLPESVAESFDMHWINDKGEKIPFGKTLGMHHDPEVHAKAMVETYKDLFDFIRNEPTIIDVQIGGERWPYDYVRVSGDISFDDYSLGEFRKYLKERFSLADIGQRYGNKADFYADWNQVYPPVSKRPLDFGKRDLANYDVSRWDWYNYRKAQTVKVWVRMIEALQELEGTGRPMYHEYGHGPYYSMGFGPFQEICAKTKGFSVGNGDFQPDLAGMLAYTILQRGCGEGPWINNELDAGCHGHHVDAAYMRRHIWGNLAAGITGYNIWTFINLQGFPYEFQNVDYSAGRIENQPHKFFETQHANKMLDSLGELIAGSTPPDPSIALLLIDDAIFHYAFALSYHQDGNNITRAMAANGYAEQLVLYTEYHLDHTDLEGITTIFMPRTQRITEARAAKLAEFVKRGGNLVLVGPTGRVDEMFKTYDVFPYGILGEVAGVEVRNLPADELAKAPLEVKWGEDLLRMDVTTSLAVPASSKAKVLASVGEKPMVTVNEYGNGRCYFLAGYPFLLDDNDATGHLLAKIVRDAGTAPAATLRTNGKVNNGVFAGHRVSEHGPLLMLIENADRAHDLDVTLDPATLGLNAADSYQVFEVFSEEAHKVSASNGWKFPTTLEPVGVRAYLVTTASLLDEIIPASERMKIGRGPDTVYVERATREQPYRASDIIAKREEYVRGFIVDAADVQPGPPIDLGGGFSALDLAAYSANGLNTMIRDVPNLISPHGDKPALLAPGPNRDLGDVPVLVPDAFVLCMGEARGIPVGQKAAKLHFFHGGNLSEHRSVLGHYRVYYADGSVVPVPIVYGTTLSDFSRGSKFPSRTQKIWTHENKSLHRYDWINPRPDETIDRIDIVHAGRKNEKEAIRLWAITTQSPSPSTTTE